MEFDELISYVSGGTGRQLLHLGIIITLIYVSTFFRLALNSHLSILQYFYVDRKFTLKVFFNMVPTYIFKFFIAAAAIAPVISLPLPAGQTQAR